MHTSFTNMNDINIIRIEMKTGIFCTWNECIYSDISSFMLFRYPLPVVFIVIFSYDLYDIGRYSDEYLENVA